MAQFVDTAIEVQSVTNDVVKIRFGESLYEVPKAQLQALMNGEEYSQFDLLMKNIAIALALGAVDLQDDVAIKREIERRTYKTLKV